MGRKPKESTTTPTQKKDGKVETELRKKYGNIVTYGDDIVNYDKPTISICPTLDLAHSGGIQEGSFIIFGGPPRCGKTTTSLYLAAKAQRPLNGSRKVVYLNAEARIEKRDLLGIPGLEVYDSNKFVLIQSAAPTQNPDGTFTPGKILTAEDYLSICETYLINEIGCVIILDSISAMCEEAEWTGGLGTQTRGGAQKLFAQFTRRMGQVFTTNRHIFVGIVHIMANTSGMGSPILEKISNAAQYTLKTKFRCKKFEPWIVGEQQIGQIVHWKCERSPLGPPGMEMQSYLRYGQGIDELHEYIVLGEQIGLIEKNGAWYRLNLPNDTEKRTQVQGMERLREFLSNHHEDANLLAQSVRENLGLPVTQ